MVVFCLGIGLGTAAGCKSLPSLDGRTSSSALSDSGSTRLGMALAPHIAAHPGKSGIHALPDALNAFAARVLLAQMAERTLDIQYYIWHKDMSGALLFDSLRQAADRGVRVRLLLDDHNTVGLDSTLAALDAHPNIEVRLFNPFVIRQPRLFGYVTDFSRVNRRMHNKSFTADNQATIIGGRNVGDEYFGATDGVVFVDLDVLAVGPVAQEVSADFDRYWASESAYPVDRLLPPASAEQMQALAADTSDLEQRPTVLAYLDATRKSSFISDLTQGSLAMQWASTRMVSDDPAKGLGRAAPEANLSHQLGEIIGGPVAELDLVSAYFVPTAAGVGYFTRLAEKGVQVRILTNSLEATDVAVVHAGYAKRRKELLRQGVALFELRRLGSSSGERTESRVGVSSGSSLHAKTFSVDNSRVFIGSFNFDPRSADLNTELGFVIDSPEMAQRIKDALARRVPRDAYQVLLSDEGKLYWLEHRQGRTIRHDNEPGTSIWQRAGVWLMSLLPIEWML